MQTKTHNSQDTETLSSMLQLKGIEDIVSSGKTRSSGKGKRIAFYSHDTLGLGHLRRTLKIAREVTSLFPEISALIISGSPDVGLVTNQLSASNTATAKIDVIKLPSVKKLNNDNYTARFLPDDIKRIVAIRSEILIGVIKTFEPHLLLVDHAPLGMCGELLPTFEWIKNTQSTTKLAYGMRDIIDDHQSIQQRWTQDNIYSVLQNTYDKILIYGDPRLIPTAKLYDIPNETLDKTNYCGYISDNSWRETSRTFENQSNQTHKKRQRVIVTIGGGDYYGPEIIGAYLTMLKERQSHINFDSVLITGPLLNPDLYRKYTQQAKDLPATIHSSVERIPELLVGSDALITTAGYNSAVDALSYAKQTLMAPRISMRQEQILRAKALDEIGAVTMFDPNKTTANELFELVTLMLKRSDSPLQQFRESNKIDLDGSIRAAAICGELMTLKV